MYIYNPVREKEHGCLTMWLAIFKSLWHILETVYETTTRYESTRPKDGPMLRSTTMLDSDRAPTATRCGKWTCARCWPPHGRGFGSPLLACGKFK